MTGRTRDVAVGVDTSNYTTSLCIVALSSGELLHEDRRLLKVPPGERGLMQSAALFQHVQHLPALLERMRQAAIEGGWNVRVVGVSDRPRAVQGSYMPVFHAGVLAAQAMAAAAHVGVLRTTHQAGHIAAGLATSGMILPVGERFLALHLSGGTTDVLLGRTGASGYDLRTFAEGLDLHVGQFVDRVGVKLGLPFPAGPQLEMLASRWDGPLPSLPSAVRDGRPSFSGPLAAAIRLIERGVSPAAVAAAAERAIATTIEKMIRFARERTGIGQVLLVGGVASNRAIRARLLRRFGQEDGAAGPLYFCAGRFSSDNALGVALIARESLPDGLMSHVSWPSLDLREPI